MTVSFQGLKPLATILRPYGTPILALLLGVFFGCGGQTGGGEPQRMIVLGIDGMDHALTEQYMAKGILPNFSRLAEQGTFQALGTSVPPLSPVAWSNFITGMDSGGHGIFDFIHRDAGTMIPYLSTTRTEAGGNSLKLGKYQFPLSGGGIELLRHGEPFWQELESHGIESTIIRIPANFPPTG